MNLSLLIAKRYIVAKKSHNLINIISAISVLGVFVGSAALIIVLSVFNGFESLVVSLFNSFDPDVKITALHGKFIQEDKQLIHTLQQTEGIKAFTYTIEENSLLKYKDKQFIATLKGVLPTQFDSVSGLKNTVNEGQYIVQSDSENYAVIGQGIAYQLSLNLGDYLNPIQVYMPKAGKNASLNPEESFNTQFIFPSGVFSIQQDFDSKYVIVPMRFLQELLNKPNTYTSLEIAIKDNADKEAIINELKSTLGERYKVANRFEQHETLYKIMRVEKWAIFFILTFILIIAAFNIIGSLTMLIVDKKKDIQILKNLGADSRLIRRIFITEGMLISLSGAIFGLLIGALVCFLQQQYGLIKLGTDDNFIIKYYPIKMILSDFIYVFITVLVIGLFAAWYPAKTIVKKLS